MKFKKYFNGFCGNYGYTGSMGYNDDTEEYHIIISKGDNNAGAFMTKTELTEMKNYDIEALLNFLHSGFILKFNK